MNRSLFPGNVTSAPFLLDASKNLAGQQRARSTVIYREYIKKTVFCAIKQNFSVLLQNRFEDNCFEDNCLIPSVLGIPQSNLFGAWLKCLILTRCKYTGLKQVLGHQLTRAEGSQNYVTSSEVWKCAEEEALKRTLAALRFMQNVLCIFFCCNKI